MIGAFRNWLIGLVTLFAMFAAAAPSHAKTPSGMIDRLAGEAISIAADKNASAADKQKSFEKLFREGFDVPLIARIVLGRYWRVATPEQQQEYLGLFRSYIVATYTARLSAYTGQVLKVTGERPLNDRETMVSSEIRDPGGQSLAVQWRIIKRENGNRIVDVIVEGVSMAITQRSEFASIISSSGGVEGLLARLRSNTKAS